MPRRRIGPRGIIASGVAGASTAAAGLSSADYIPQPLQIALIPISGVMTAAAAWLVSPEQGTAVPHQKKILGREVVRLQSV
jgi:hypothetical protein